MSRSPQTRERCVTPSPNGPGHIDETQIEELRDTAPQILERLFDITDLTRSFRCPSPDHEDRTPSARYLPKGRIVGCLGCGGRWDVFDLAGMALGLDSFPDKVRAVAEITGTELRTNGGRRMTRTIPATKARKPSTAPQPPEASRDLSAQLMDAFDALYTAEGSVARAWLRDTRGFTDDDIVRHGLGFTKHPKGVMAEFAVHEPAAAGYVVIPFWKDNRCSAAPYAMLRTIPAPGAAARTKEWRPKGVRSQLWQEWALSARLPAVYVVEGLLDAIALQKMTGKTCVALGGTSMAGKFVCALERVPVKLRPGCVVICMDTDKAGRHAADEIARGLDRLCVAHAELAGYPQGAKDANEWLLNEKGRLWKVERDVDFLGMSLAGGALPPLTRTVWLDGERG